MSVLFRVLSVAVVPAVLLLTCGCASDAPDNGDGPVVEHLGDTVQITSFKPSEGVFVADSIEVLYQSRELERPSVVVPVLDGYIAVDRTRLHLLARDGGSVRIVGREGEGPGEYLQIEQVGVRGDTIFVLDYRQRRLSWLALDGEFLGSVGPLAMAGDRPLSVDRGKGRLAPAGAGVLFHVQDGRVSTSYPVRVGLAWVGFDGEGFRVVEQMDDVQFADAGRGLVPRDPFGPRALFALGSAGEYAASDGREYCVRIERLEGTELRRVCRAWERLPVTNAAREPDLSSFPEEDRDLYRSWIEIQEPSELWPSHRSLLFGSDGRLWVETVDERYRDVSPMAVADQPDLRPYDGFTAEGELGWTVEVPRAFRPSVFEASSVVGILELPTGELVVARAHLRPGPG